MKETTSVINPHNKARNITFDLMKLYAMLSVVMDHTLKRWIEGVQSTQLYNFIFLSQMPIFMFIAGYFFYKHLKEEYSVERLFEIMKKCIIGLLIPYVSYGLLVSWNNGNALSILSIFLYPDNSLWFLWALMWMELLMLIAQQISKLICPTMSIIRVLVACLLYCISMFPVLFMYKKYPKYFETKLIIYYSIFFLLGICIHWGTENYKWIIDDSIKNMIMLVSIILVVSIMYTHPQVIFDDETINNMIVRVIGSMACIYLIWRIMDALSKRTRIQNVSLFGRYSLEMYYVHSLLLKVPYMKSYINSNSLLVISFIYLTLYMIVIITSAAVIKVINSNRISRLICFGKM